MNKSSRPVMTFSGGIPAVGGGKRLSRGAAVQTAPLLEKYFVLLAENADPSLTGPLQALCRARAVPVRWVPTMQELGHACRLSVGAAAAAVCTE